MASKLQKSIGCQDLLLTENATGYWLRKQKKVFAKIFSSSGGLWYRRYAVIREDCIYLFKNESSDKPSGTIVLHNCKVSSIDKPLPKYPPWCFTIVMNDTKKTHIFSISSGKELRDVTTLLSQSCVNVTKRESSRKVDRGHSSGIESAEDSSAGSVYVEREDNDGDDDDGEESEYETVEEFMGQTDNPKLSTPSTSLAESTSLHGSAVGKTQPAAKVKQPEPKVMQAAAKVLQATSSSPLHKTHSARSVPPVPQPSARKHSSVSVPLKPSSADDVDDDYPQIPLPEVPKTGRHLPTSKSVNLASPLVLPAAPLQLRSKREAVEHSDVSSESGTETADDASLRKPPPVAPKPALHVVRGKTVEEIEEELFQKRTFWNGSTAEAKIYLEQKAVEGMYLIRNGKDGKVLMLFCEDGCKQYRLLTDQHGKHFISKETMFESCKDLINFYSIEFLPTYPIRLRMPYNASNH